MKTCNKCKETKPLSEFYKNSKSEGVRGSCKLCTLKYQRDWIKKNPEKFKKQNERYIKTHLGMVRDRKKKYMRKFRCIPKVNINHRMSALIYKCLKKKKNGWSWEEIVGYTTEDLMAHLEGLFLPGMSWENYSAWHIDHIIPKSRFNYDNPFDPEFKECWSLTNLQPLWAEDNIRKGSKVS